MIATLLFGAVVFLGYKLYQVNKQRQIAYQHYMNDRVVGGNQYPPFMVGPDGQRRPMWCPNCGNNL